MIKIEKEPDEFSHFPLEHCLFCDEPTKYWAKKGDTPVCPKCAKKHEESDIATYDFISDPEFKTDCKADQIEYDT